MINRSNVFVYIGTFLSQCLTLLTSLIVLKYISPEAYGRFNYIISFGSIIGSLATLKFEQSIAISKDLSDCTASFKLSIQTSTIISAVICPFIFFFFDVSLFQCFLIFLLSISIAIFASLQQFFLFTNRHKLNAVLTILVALFNIIFLLFLYKADNGLEVSYVSAYFLSNILFLIYTNFKVVDFKLFFIRGYKILFRKYSFFPAHVLPTAIISILLLYGNSIALKHLYSEQEVGLFSFTVRILTLPVILISSVSSGLFKTKLAELYHGKDSSRFKVEMQKMLKFLLISMAVVFPILVFLLLNMGAVINIGKWQVLDKLVYILVFYAISQYILIPFQGVPILLNKKNVIVVSNTILFIGILSLYVIATLIKVDFDNFLIGYSIFNMLFSIIAVYIYFNLGIKWQKESF